MLEYSYIAGTVLLTVYGQIVLKWRVSLYGILPELLNDKLLFFTKLFSDPFILSGFFAAFLASLFWMAAMSKLELSHAYPFMALNFVLVLILSGLFFGEALTAWKIVGISLVIVGVIVGSQG